MKKNILIVIAAMLFLFVGCSKPKNNEVVGENHSTQEEGNKVEESDNQTQEEFFYEGVVDTDSLCLVQEFVEEMDGTAQKAYITLPSSMEAESFDDIYGGGEIEQMEFGTQFRLKGRDEVTIEIYTSAISGVKRSFMSCKTNYGQDVFFSDETLAETLFHGKPVSLRGEDDGWFYVIEIDCPEEWLVMKDAKKQ